MLHLAHKEGRGRGFRNDILLSSATVSVAGSLMTPPGVISSIDSWLPLALYLAYYLRLIFSFANLRTSNLFLKKITSAVF